MNLHLFRGRWCTIVCPPSGVFVTARRGFIIGAVCRLLLALTYPQCYFMLLLVHLVQVPRVYLILSPDPRY